MSPDAATTLAQQIKTRHLSSHGERGSYVCAFCSTRTDDLPWPCDAIEAADMLLELARDGERLDWLEAHAGSVNWGMADVRLALTTGWDVCSEISATGRHDSPREAIDAAIDAVRNAIHDGD
ncbi:MAG: hypothetical protein SFX73_11755 [Kofleriaceae bacterium]|nr:hypothetical protein [Kofleriaceae bacterium]